MTLLETVKHYVTAAREAITVADRNLNATNYRSAVHEAYYAAFYAATAALATRELNFKRHTAVVGTFNRLFVHEESLFPAETARGFQRLLEYRLRFDYEPVPGEKDAAEYALETSRAFIAEVVPYLDTWLEKARDKQP